MSTQLRDPAPRYATVLNDSCQCIWLDRDRLRRQLEQNVGDAGQLIESRPGLASGSVVFVDPQDAAAMDQTAQLVNRALSSPAFQHRVAGNAPSIARQPCSTSSGVLGLDFHLGTPLPQLIEINTNPGGLLINLELARAVTAACDCMAQPLEGLAGTVPLAQLPQHVIENFQAEWNAARAGKPLRSVAIVDDDPLQQYLHPEFLLYQHLFRQAGWSTRICDAAELEYRDGALVTDGTQIDLVYNRLTDFYLAESRHAALRAAYEDHGAVVVPHPASHAHWADKRLLAWLRDESLLKAAGLDEGERAHLRCSIPPTEIVDAAAADDLWLRRKELFFKPVDGYGSKAAYRGDKLTRSTFAHILSHPYVAQAVAPTSTRRVVVAGEESDLRVDIRNYCHQGSTWLRAARLYRGQTTNFRTPGGGFAPVLALQPL
jgi:hypothetical protein